MMQSVEGNQAHIRMSLLSHLNDSLKQTFKRANGRGGTSDKSTQLFDNFSVNGPLFHARQT